MIKKQSTKLLNVKKLLDYLIKAPDFVSLNEIMANFNISRRTSFNWLSMINQLLQENNLDKIINVSHYGYKISDRTKLQLTSDSEILPNLTEYSHKDLSSDERQTAIILFLINKNDNVSINKFATMFDCSRNTVISDFKIIKKSFPQLTITSSRLGHKITGNEIDIRTTIYELLIHDNKLVLRFIEQLDFSLVKAKQIILNSQQQLQMNFSENSIKLLTYLLVFSKWRIVNDNSLRDDADYYWIDTNTSTVLPTCTEILNLFVGESYSKGEVTFLSKVILCSQATEVGCVNKKLYDDLNHIAQEMIFRYEQLTEQQISYKIFTKVLCNHLYATFFRVKFGIPFTSNEVNEIKRQYPELIKFTAIACVPLEQYLHKKLPSDEIALICLYFGSANNQDYQDLSNTDKVKRASLAEVLVVCSSGIGTSAMLYYELTKLYPLIKFSLPLEIRDIPKVFNYNYQAKLIISTASLNTATYPIPVVNVKAVLTKHDQNIIEKFLRENMPRQIEHNAGAVDRLVTIINEYADVKDENGLRSNLDRFIFPENNRNNQFDLPSLASLLPTNHIKFLKNKPSLSWEEALQIGCQILEQDGVIANSYLQEIIKLIKKYGPYMLIANNIFLAHAAPSDSSRAVGLSLVRLDMPLEIKARDQSVWVKCIFVLSPGLNREHERALEQLVDIVGSGDIEQLFSAKTPKEARKFLLSVY
ncbi:PTS sugar transporter subunit IIA [Lactobacillus sp. ESL0681]|uniref:BglG family transcription antiterminator n=1 Tax=Lactobacillus sp. ESL0681 TaxID=2983211 RepID=UPI0023F77B92|nr:PTS sugar transporter subunit IIA [Lactobacillus sp. ESL0681]WEV41184.1 PTS sugar transporter subunit IIA [Lactobacillus sp. ESL0681]